jgi:glycosyltransferase involved in cell wall biosynthesis
MKYPNVLFYRFDKYSFIDDIFFSESEKLECTIYIINESQKLNLLFDSNYQILVTYGEDEKEYYNSILPFISKRMCDRWIHLKEIYSIENFNNSVNYCFIHNCSLPREHMRPKFSIFTTCYNSYEKIIRAFKSLKNQTFIDWEWVIIDDSTEEEHFIFLQKNLLQDDRVRMYKRSHNSGNIGNVKNEAVSLCRGKYVLELDHDDEVLPNILKDSFDFFEKNQDVGFIYMNFANIYENGDNFSYSDFICKGYGSYYCEKYNGKWVYVYNTPNINNITLSHLVCCPNHPRIWKREVLISAGNYCEMLPICDDYEILLRTFLITKTAKINKLGYIQYMNDNNNNFSLIRNSEINRIGPQFIMPIFYEKFKIHDFMKQQNAYEDEKYIHEHSQIWTRDLEKDNYKHVYSNIIYNPDYDKQYCILGIDSLIQNMNYIIELYKEERNNFILLDNIYNVDYITKQLDDLSFSKMKCYSLKNATQNELLQYFMIMYKFCENYEIISSINPNLDRSVKYNTQYQFRHEIINSLTTAENKYLEIGVEYGETFNNIHFSHKIGVDPDPKFQMENSEVLKIMTSDEFFENNPESFFDVIFIDGMHQSEFVIRDINNSIQYLNNNGKIFIDDIIPISYNEQLKIPSKHYYEKGILKYGEPWTGDVWKVMFYILKHHSIDIEFTYFNNKNYRGVGLLQIKNKFEIKSESLNEINSYDYWSDFNEYIALLHI